MTAQRWSVRVLAIPYYLAIGPFLYDLFVYGVRWRSLYLFLYVILSVAGLQIGYKESDFWVRVWYWTNLPFVAFITWLAFFNSPFAKLVALYPWEKWIHFTMFVILTLFYPLRYFIMRKPMKVIGDEDDEEEDVEEPLPPVAPKVASPTPATPAPAPIAVAAPTPPPTETTQEEPTVQDDGGFLGKL
jgi:hypothetical protein